MTTLASMHRVKYVVLEYSPRDKRVYVRAVLDGEPTGRNPYSPVHEDNRLEYIRVTEGVDMMQNGCAWALGELEADPYIATTRLSAPVEGTYGAVGLNSPVQSCVEVSHADFVDVVKGALEDLHKKNALEDLHKKNA